MKNNKLVIAILALVIMFCFSFKEDKPKLNILFIAVDDLRPELNCYGNTQIISPNIDKLAAGGLLFQNHFVVVPTCGASRHSLLTGTLPRDLSQINNNALATNLSNKPETEIPETFIHMLKKNSYYTVGIGKISHYPDGYVYPYDGTPAGAKLELPYSWNEMLLNTGKWGTGHNAFFGYADGSNRNTLNGQVKPYESADVSDEGYPDGLTAQLAVNKLKELKDKDQPFFLAVGFFKPHLPFNAPKKYWDLYDEAKIALPAFTDIPKNSVQASLQNSGEFNSYKMGEERASLEKPVSDEYARHLKHGYYAAISYVDTQIGKVLDELEAQGLAENTIVVLWGDHGWHLGEQRVWGKHTCFDISLRSPLIIRHPDFAKSQLVSEVVSTVDIYPTLMDFCNLKAPENLDGNSMKVLFNEPDANWPNMAYSYFNKGITVRDDRYRITRYFRTEKPEIELYDMKYDPNETENIAANNPEIVKSYLPNIEKANTGLYSTKK